MIQIYCEFYFKDIDQMLYFIGSKINGKPVIEMMPRVISKVAGRGEQLRWLWCIEIPQKYTFDSLRYVVFDIPPCFCLRYTYKK